MSSDPYYTALVRRIMMASFATALLLAILGVQATAAQKREVLPSDFAARAAAARRLIGRVQADAELLHENDFQIAVLALLEQENRLVAASVRSVARGEPPLVNSEAYSEHYAEVLGLAKRVWDAGVTGTERHRLLRELVLGTYNPGSSFADELARVGEPLTPFVLEAVAAPNGPTRWNGYGLIVRVLQRADEGALDSPVSSSTRTAYRTAARNGLLDPAPDVRRAAIPAVVAARDKDAIPLLRQLAEMDPDRGTGRSVRTLARSAVQQLDRMRDK